MPSGLRRYYGKGQLHFITFSCYQRRPLLKTPRARNIVVEELKRVRREMGFLLIGYVVMPEHVHLLISEPPRGTPSDVLHQLKLRVAKRLRGPRKRKKKEQMELPFTTCVEPPRSFWQARFYDFNVYSVGKKKEKLNYMHANPVKRGLVNHPRDWAWSSWGFYFGAQEPLIAMDV
jgi:putative transposase